MSAARDGAVDVTIDEEQESAYQRSCDLLLAAGYFRARILSLSRFDKLIGGLTWCIVGSGVDIQMEILFEEEATIGKQIELGETIEEALKRMSCPFPLQSHQIRGLDTVHIFPVIQWLVKKVLEMRAEFGDTLRQLSLAQYRQTFSHATPAGSSSYLHSLTQTYKPRRRFRKHSDDEDPSQRVLSTLLEYGHLRQASLRLEDDPASSSHKKSRGALGESPEDRAKRQVELSRDEARKAEALLSKMQAAASAVSGSALGGLFDAQSGEIAAMARAYASRLEADGGNEEHIQRLFGEEIFARQMAAKTRAFDAARGRLPALLDAREAVEKSVLEEQAALQKAAALNARIESEIAKLEALETPENAGVLAELRRLVGLHELLKEREAEFREGCGAERAEWKKRLAAVGGGTLSPEEEERKRVVAERYGEDMEKVAHVRAMLAKKNREIASVMRKIDDKPARSELQQYQRQFAENFEQMQKKYIETKLYYEAYNMYSDIKTFLEKEISILNSIEQSYNEAMKSEKNTKNYADSMKGIIEGVNKNLGKFEDKLKVEREEFEKMNQKYLELVAKEREYHALTKEFKEVCEINAKLNG